jgi:XTP/dITP diphosphohydrolase
MKSGAELVVASHNPGKVREIFELLAPLSFVVKGAAELGLSEPEETGTTFAENAVLKARAAAEATGLLSLSDDSGLVVFALNGAPGIYSARWAGEKKDFAQAMARVESELREISTNDYAAKFVCALSLAQPNGETQVFEGEVHGQLTFPPRGTKGFGYDPIFIADGMHETFGEIEPSHKHAISHRARAFAKLANSLSFPASGRGAPQGRGSGESFT